MAEIEFPWQGDGDHAGRRRTGQGRSVLLAWRSEGARWRGNVSLKCRSRWFCKAYGGFGFRNEDLCESRGAAATDQSRLS